MKLAYWASTGLLCALMLMSASLYLFNHETAAGFFVALGFPTWLIYPLATAKILAVVAITTKRSAFFKEWAYAGIFFDVVLALAAHTIAGDGGGAMALGGVVLVVTSYVLDGKFYGNAAFARPTSV